MTASLVVINFTVKISLKLMSLIVFLEQCIFFFSSKCVFFCMGNLFLMQINTQARKVPFSPILDVSRKYLGLGGMINLVGEHQGNSAHFLTNISNYCP